MFHFTSTRSPCVSWNCVRNGKYKKCLGWITRFPSGKGRWIDIYTYIELSIIHGTNGARKIWFQDRKKIKLVSERKVKVEN